MTESASWGVGVISVGYKAKIAEKIAPAGKTPIFRRKRVHAVSFRLQPGYNVRKAVHVVAYFALKAGGSINVLKLVKLAYLADRLFLSEYEITVLGSVWKRFGHMNQWQLRDYTHDNCPEWEDPFKSSYVIPYERIFKYLGRGEHSEALERDINTRIELDRALAQDDPAVAAVA